MYSKTFYDLACGGSKEAKAQAVAWRDEQLTEVKALTLLEFHQQRRSNNLSGVPGVNFHRTACQPLGFRQAKIWFHSGKSLAKSFSVLKFGDEEAYRLAVDARTDLLAQVENKPFLHHPIAKRLSGRK